MKTQHEKWYAGEVISVGIGQGAVQVTPLQLARALGGIASGGALKRPHVVFPDELPPDMQSAIDATLSRQRRPHHSHHARKLGDHHRRHGRDHRHAAPPAQRHLEGIDFAGKTGTAQVVNHSAGATSLGTGNERANAWFVGMAPRRNPDIVVAVLV